MKLKDQSNTTTSPEGATAVITHKVREDMQAEYEQWVEKIKPQGVSFPGYLDSTIIQPIAGISLSYTVIIRFDSEKNLRNWMESPARTELVNQVRPLLINDDDFFINSGLDFWFAPSGAKAKVPVRWKQYLVTWSVIFPLSSTMSMLLTPLLLNIGIPNNRFILSLFITGLVVFLMVYVIMPRYTNLVKRWLFN